MKSTMWMWVGMKVTSGRYESIGWERGVSDSWIWRSKKHEREGGKGEDQKGIT